MNWLWICIPIAKQNNEMDAQHTAPVRNMVHSLYKMNGQLFLFFFISFLNFWMMNRIGWCGFGCVIFGFNIGCIDCWLAISPNLNESISFTSTHTHAHGDHINYTSCGPFSLARSVHNLWYHLRYWMCSTGDCWPFIFSIDKLKNKKIFQKKKKQTLVHLGFRK